MKYLLFLFCLVGVAVADGNTLHLVSAQAGIDIHTQKVIRISGPITPAVMIPAVKGAINTQVLPGPRVVILDSPGGIAEIGDMFINALLKEKQDTGNKIICVANHNASSMAFDILTYCDVRLVTPKSHMLVHALAYEFSCAEPPRARLTAKNLREMAEDLELSDLDHRKANAEAMHLSLADYDLFADNETVWTGESLLKMGYFNGTATITYE